MLADATAALLCRHCRADVAVCLVGLDPDAIERALQDRDARCLLALGLWQCTACARRDVLDLDTRPTDTWLTLAREGIADRIASLTQAHAARARFRARNLRLARDADERARERAASSANNASKSAVEAALARARLARPGRTRPGT